MKWNEYTSLFDDVLNNDNNEAPYDNPEYVNYVKMNQSRSNRWLKSDVLNEELIKKIEAKKINSPYSIYLMALLAFSQEDIDAGMGLLKKAISKDERYKIIANNEPDLQDLQENEEFLAIIE